MIWADGGRVLASRLDSGQAGLNIQLAPDRRMIGRLFPAPGGAVDAGRAEQISGLRRQHQMIDADAVVFLPGAALVIPK